MRICDGMPSTGHCSSCAIFNDVNLVGHFVASPSEKEIRDRRQRGKRDTEETEGKANDSGEKEEIGHKQCLDNPQMPTLKHTFQELGCYFQ